MIYKFYSKYDKHKEAIGKIEAKDYKEAINHFAEFKKLPLEKFNKIYEVTNNTDGKKRFTFRRN